MNGTQQMFVASRAGCVLQRCAEREHYDRQYMSRKIQYFTDTHVRDIRTCICVIWVRNRTQFITKQLFIQPIGFVCGLLLQPYFQYRFCVDFFSSRFFNIINVENSKKIGISGLLGVRRNRQSKIVMIPPKSGWLATMHQYTATLANGRGRYKL